MQYTTDITLETEECCNCGMVFAMTADFAKRRRKDGKSFYCPAGHSQHYVIGKTEEQKLREQLATTERQRLDAVSNAQQERERANKVAKAYGKIRDRVKNGVCPCCNRTFQNLLQHMQTQHPEFGTREMLKPLRELFGLTQAALAEELGTNAAQVSNYERSKPVPAYVHQAVEQWLATHAA